MLVHQVSHCSINAIGRFRVATTVPRAVPAVTAARRASQRPRQLQPPRATPESEPNDDKEKGNKQAEKRRKRYAKVGKRDPAACWHVVHDYAKQPRTDVPGPAPFLRRLWRSCSQLG